MVLHCTALYHIVSYVILWYPIPLQGIACYSVVVGCVLQDAYLLFVHPKVMLVCKVYSLEKIPHSDARMNLVFKSPTDGNMFGKKKKTCLAKKTMFGKKTCLAKKPCLAKKHVWQKNMFGKKHFWPNEFQSI